MLMKADRLRLKMLFSRAIRCLCKSNLGLHSEFQIDAMIGITFGDSDVALICINEMVTDDSEETTSQIHGADRDLVTEEFEYQELGGKSFESAEGHHIGNEFYGDVVEAEKCEERWAGSETFGNGCEDVENGVSSGQHLYDDKMAEDGGRRRSGAIVTGSEKRKRSFAAGSDQFSEKEFDRGAEDRVTVKDEPGLNDSDFNETFGFVKPQSPSQRVHNPDADFVSLGVASKSRFRSWPNKKKNSGLQFGRKVLGNKKASMNAATPTTSSALQSHADQRVYLDELCRGLVQDSIAQTQFYCHICNTKLSSKGVLATHMKGSHTDAKLYPCDQCDQSFKWRMQLHRHRNSCHSAAAGGF